MESNTKDNAIMGAYMHVGALLVKELDTMTVGERESLLDELGKLEQGMACIGLKKLFVEVQHD